MTMMKPIKAMMVTLTRRAITWKVMVNEIWERNSNLNAEGHPLRYLAKSMSTICDSSLKIEKNCLTKFMLLFFLFNLFASPITEGSDVCNVELFFCSFFAKPVTSSLGLEVLRNELAVLILYMALEIKL